MRNIREIRTLSILELTDEEIVKAAMDRMKSRAVMLVYENPDDLRYTFLGRYKKGGRLMLRQLEIAWEEKFGKFKKIEENEE